MVTLEIKTLYKKEPDTVKVFKHDDHQIRLTIEDGYAMTTVYMSELETDLLVRILTNAKNGVNKVLSNGKHASRFGESLCDKHGMSGQCRTG